MLPLVTRQNFPSVNFSPLNLLTAYSVSITEMLLSHDKFAVLMWTNLLKKSFHTAEMSRKVLHRVPAWISYFPYSTAIWRAERHLWDKYHTEIIILPEAHFCLLLIINTLYVSRIFYHLFSHIFFHLWFYIINSFSILGFLQYIKICFQLGFFSCPRSMEKSEFSALSVHSVCLWFPLRHYR